MQGERQLQALLQRTDFFGTIFAALDEADIRPVLASFRPERFEAGQQIFSRGDPGNHIMVVASGRIRISVMSDDGRELSVRHATEGHVIGEIATLDGGPRSAEAVALTPVQAFLFMRADLQRLQSRFAHVAPAMVTFLCKRLRDTTEQLEAIALYPIEVRLARFLLVALQGRAAEPGKRIPLELGFSQSELAQLLGASRPKVNGALRMLEEMGAIKRTSDRLFCSPALLMKVAGRTDDV
ncbi:MAG: Crp/Fnr family transcriptional regulator [Beijerinckiaceae bacterium]